MCSPFVACPTHKGSCRLQWGSQALLLTNESSVFSRAAFRLGAATCTATRFRCASTSSRCSASAMRRSISSSLSGGCCVCCAELLANTCCSFLSSICRVLLGGWTAAGAEAALALSRATAGWLAGPDAERWGRSSAGGCAASSSSSSLGPCCMCAWFMLHCGRMGLPLSFSWRSPDLVRGNPCGLAP